MPKTYSFTTSELLGKKKQTVDLIQDKVRLPRV
jgi:hypothetical protein